MILNVVGALRTVRKVLEKRFKKLKIKGRIATIQTSLKYSEEFWKPKGSWSPSDSREIPLPNTDLKSSRGVKR